MARSANDELESLKASIMEKNRLIDQQTNIINRQLEALNAMGELRLQLEECHRRLVEADSATQLLQKEIDNRDRFRKRVLNHWFIRLMHWFRDE